MSNFVQIRKEAWKYYQIWMKEKTRCKALNCEIKITRMGWNHLLDRKIKEKINRFRLLKVAKAVIKQSENYKVNRQDGINYYVLEDKALLNGRYIKIKVLIKKDKKGNYVFYSVMKT